jgi:hypothetical protein
MKTTFDLPDDLFVAAKQQAAQERTTLKSIVERGLRSQLSRPARAQGRLRARPGAVRWVTVNGGLPADVDLTNRVEMHDWLRRTR